VFLHAVKEGPANRSYGLQVAQLAGVPRGVIAEARRYLEHLEAERDRQRATSSAAERLAAQAELPLHLPGAPVPDALRETLRAIDPDTFTPRQALETLYALRRLLDSS